MKEFMSEDFLLSTPTAKKLFDVVKDAPVLDYHCHISQKEIAEDKRFENITQVWLYGDHYKWRLMREAGIDEKYITGDASDHDKFMKWAEALETAFGNPLYHWSHLELKKYFGISKPLSSDTAEEIWNETCEKLKDPALSVRGIVKMSNVKLICTTDDPVDSLEYHKQIAEDESFDVQVVPAWRPDKALNIEKPDFTTYINKLAEVSGVTIDSFSALKEALSKRMDFFSSMGCHVSDHALQYVMYAPADELTVNKVFTDKLAGKEPSNEEMRIYKTAFMSFVAAEYKKRDWVMQLHIGAKRDNNTNMYKKLGPDTGYDSIYNYLPADQLCDFLDSLEVNGNLGKTVLYSLNPADNAMLATVLGCFSDSYAAGKVIQGIAWWFNDNLKGMREQISTLASIGNISVFLGMLTDSRSFLSYTRHDYFRRLFCDMLGDAVENGEFPDNERVLTKLVKNISYNNAVKYFNFNLDTI